MKFSTMSRRVAATGAVTALAAGALVAATATTATSAEGVTGDATYTCAIPEGFGGPQPLGVTVTVPDVSAYDGLLPAGAPAPANAVSAAYVFHANAALAGLLPALSSPGSDNMSFQLGTATVPVDDFAFDLANIVPADGGGLDIPASGSNGVFALPAAGSSTLSMPTSFNFTAMVGELPVSIPCTTDAPADLGALAIPFNESTTALKASATKVKPGKTVRLTATPTGGFNTATGTVTFKDGDKTLATKDLNSDGIAKFKVRNIKKGKHKFRAVYSGDGFRNPSTSSAVKVVAKR